MMRRARRPKPKPLAALVSECLTAPAVYLALESMAAERGSAVITPTREDLARLTGLSLETVSKGLTALDKARWIHRAHVPKFSNGVRVATLLRIVLNRRAECFRATQRRAVERKNSAKGNAENFRQDFTKVKRAHERRPLLAVGSAPKSEDTYAPNPSENLLPVDSNGTLVLAETSKP
ncbi:MAG TPA: helix-turn-helix domain-containing protein [Planctomycetota bacterium]|nr:helix-turn-helix domain-containing protein [Planctomycetota bacterium]